MKQANISYNEELNELHIVFKEVEIPIIFELDNNVLLEFDDDTLCSIVLPNFSNMLKMPINVQTAFTLSDLKIVDEIMTITMNVNGEINININVNVSSLK